MSIYYIQSGGLMPGNTQLFLNKFITETLHFVIGSFIITDKSDMKRLDIIIKYKLHNFHSFSKS